MDIGESISQAAIREVKEESGIDCEIAGLVGIYTDPKHVIFYTSNGEARQEFSVVFRAEARGGKPTASTESSEVLWVRRTRIDDYRMEPSMRLRISHYMESSPTPHIA